MGLLAKLFGKKEDLHISPSRKDDVQPQAAPAPEAPVMSVRLDDERRETWNNAFRAALWEIMGTLGIFSDADMEDMYQLATENGLQDKGRYYIPIFKKYFQGREWVWPEREEWKKRFSESGKWPYMWELLKGEGGGEQERYFELMDYIYEKARNAAEAINMKRMGISTARLNFGDGYENDRFWVETIVASEPESLPPYFPRDETLLMPEMEEFKELHSSDSPDLVIKL